MRPKIFLMLAVALVVCHAASAEAMCTGDSWSSNATTLTRIGNNLFGLTATTGLSHQASHFCGGFLNVKVKLLGIGANCERSDSKYHDNDTNTSPPIQVGVAVECSRPACDQTYFAGGEHYWNDEDGTAQFTQSQEDVLPCRDVDLDNDGQTEAQGDCRPFDNLWWMGKPLSQISYCQAQEQMPSGQDENCNATWDYEDCASSPLIVDVLGDGIRLTNRAGGTAFDLNVDGIREQLPWTAVGLDDAFLVLDRNGNGLIDDGLELFGNHTAQPVSPELNGFNALAVFDAIAEGGTADGWIDAADAVFRRLTLWTDRNHDGKSQPGELVALPQTAVRRISLRYMASHRVDRWGNEYRLRSKLEAEPSMSRWIYDVFLGAKARK